MSELVDCERRNITHPIHGVQLCTNICAPLKTKPEQVKFCNDNCPGFYKDCTDLTEQIITTNSLSSSSSSSSSTLLFPSTSPSTINYSSTATFSSDNSTYLFTSQPAVDGSLNNHIIPVIVVIVVGIIIVIVIAAVLVKRRRCFSRLPLNRIKKNNGNNYGIPESNPDDGTSVLYIGTAPIVPLSPHRIWTPTLHHGRIWTIPSDDQQAASPFNQSC